MIDKLGLDIHGVCDADPKAFSRLAKLYLAVKGEVHIITGQKDSPELRDKIRNLGIPFTHFFSITSYHESIGTTIRYDERGRPWMDEEIWNRTKGQYCQRMGITIHIDDSPVYRKYFSGTTYLFYEKGDLNGYGL
jgi:hypothetical protein